MVVAVDLGNWIAQDDMGLCMNYLDSENGIEVS